MFAGVLSYNRFINLLPRVCVLMCAFLHTRYGVNTGVAFIDSTRLVVCNNKRISSNKVFKDRAKIGKTTMGWFFGFKLHLCINDMGELLCRACHHGQRG